MSKPLLQVEHLTMQFGGVVAVNDFSMEINEGEIVALIGPNGAGRLQPCLWKRMEAGYMSQAKGQVRGVRSC